jgi:GxxExxY protein
MFFAYFICFDKLVVEIKATSLHKDNAVQTINYFRCTNYPVDFMINFGQSSLTWKIFINAKTKKSKVK